MEAAVVEGKEVGAGPKGEGDLFDVADGVVGDVLAEDGHEGVITGLGGGEIEAGGGCFFENFAGETFFDGIRAAGEDVGGIEGESEAVVVDFLTDEPRADDEGGGAGVGDAEGKGALPGGAAEDGGEGENEGVGGEGEDGDA